MLTVYIAVKTAHVGAPAHQGAATTAPGAPTATHPLPPPTPYRPASRNSRATSRAMSRFWIVWRLS